MVVNRFIFDFIRYIKPTWYYNLNNNSNLPYWVNYNQLSEDEKQYIDYDLNYSNKNISDWDAAFQAFNKGIIKNDPEISIVNRSLDIQPTIKDQYRFIKKYYSPLRSVYVLIIRLLSFKNPFREMNAFLSSLRIKRIRLFSDVFRPKELSRFDSNLIRKNPKVSVIIPTLNRYKYLNDVLNDLEKQEYKNFEVLVCDQSDIIDEEFYLNRNLDLTLIRQEEKALWLARNKCIKSSKGDFLLLFDDDSRVEPDWITMHLRCLDYFQADISSGVSLSVIGGDIPPHYHLYRWSEQIDTGNVMFSPKILNITGLFDRQFEKQRMGDSEFGLRCYLKGFMNVSNPDAKRVHLKVGTGGLRQMGLWDGFRTNSLFSPKPVPSILYLSRKYFGNNNSLLLLLLNLPQSFVPYKWKGNKIVFILSIPLLLLLLPILFIQVIRSWKLSGIMLNEGAKIEKVNL